jgi:hypothetical protein
MAGTTNPSLKLLGLFAALALAVGLAACGSSDSTTSASTSESTAQDTTAGAGATGKDGSKTGGKSEAGGKSKAADKGSGNGGGSSRVRQVKFTPPPLKVSGGGSKQFVQKGGDNSIQEYGDEGGESELQEVAETVYGFYVARGEGEWAKACSYLSKSNAESLEQLVSQSPELKDAGCAAALEAFTRPLPPAASRELNKEITTVDAGSFRHEGKQGFLIYYGAPHRTVYAMPLRNEDGAWKVTALSGTTLG